jgi:hypothetical protein
MTAYRPRALSVSAVQLYAECPAKYEARYVKRLVLPTSAPMAFGKAFHAALEAEHRGENSERAFIAAWNANAAALAANGLTLEPGKAHGLTLLDLYRQRGLGGKLGEPERKVVLSLPSPLVPVPIVGYIDLPIPERRRFREFKTTSGSSWTEIKVQGEHQLHVYGWMYQHTYHHRPERAEYVIFGTGVPSVDVIEGYPSPDGLRLFELAAAATWRGVVEQRFTGCGSCELCKPAAEKLLTGPSFTWDQD